VYILAAQLVTKINRYIGTAAEIAAMTLTGIPTGSTFFESDTGILKIVNQAGVLVNAPSESVGLSGSNVEAVTFHEAAVAAADGTAFTVGGYKTLTVEILRTATSGTIAFTAEGPSGADILISGVNLASFATATSTTGTGELWQFDITGLTKVFMDITVMVAGAGSITVKGTAVA
jgi:hypothetical protein